MIWLKLDQNINLVLLLFILNICTQSICTILSINRQQQARIQSSEVFNEDLSITLQR